jgi:non-specific serine/threonine protein kinase/serine/threonine-protein kinase
MTDDLETRTSAGSTGGDTAPLGQIGAYTLIRPLGEGGMGTVYLAEQKAPVERRVALKVIKLGMDTRDVVARFEAERQALAVMDHPGIARVFDGGATDTGRPFFVMELVAGEPMTDFADRHGLGIRERVALLIDVCRAVQHAHQKGIIHRDLKPSNVLVTMQDGRPAAKIIDFGIARAIDRPADQTFATGLGQFVGTPAYMSPEQLGLTAQDVDTRADIYSLGVLLYELLAGVRPFEPRELETGRTLAVAVWGDEAKPPSARLTEAAGDKQRNIAAARRTDVVALRRMLAHELDWIALKAIEKDRSRRYDTANTLAGDLQRYLNNEPVTARPPSRGYRMRKFVARHRAGVGAAAAILVLIAAAAIVVLKQSARIARERDRATLEAQKAQAVNNFLQEMLSSANPFGAGNRSVTVVEALAAAERRLDSTLGGQPEVAGAVRRTLGQTYHGLGDYERAERLLRDAVGRSRASGRQAELAADLSQLADVLKGAGKFAESVPIAREAVDVGRAAGAAPAELADMQFVLAECLRQNGDTDAALALATDVLDARTRLLGPESTPVAASLRQLGMIASEKSDLAGAERHFLRAAAIHRQQGGPEHYMVAGTLNDLAVTYITASQFDRALEALQEVNRIQRIVLGDVHPELATTVENLANVLYRLKRFPEATAHLEEALAIRRQALGDDSMPVARTTFNLGMVYSDSGELARAEVNLVDGVARLRRALGKNHPDLVSALRGLSLLRERQGQLQDAERNARESLALAEQVLGADHVSTASSQQRLGMTLLKLARYAEAETHFLRSRSIREQRLGPTAGATQQVVANLVTLYTAWGKPEKAHALKK